jgi:hypothetical protein
MDPVTFDVRFHSDPTFKDLAARGGSAPNAALVDSTGMGAGRAQQTDSSVRGRRDSDTRAFVFTNPDALDVLVGWDDHVCGLFGNLAGTLAADEKGDQSLTAVLRRVESMTPQANAGRDGLVECTPGDTLCSTVAAAAIPRVTLSSSSGSASGPASPSGSAKPSRSSRRSAEQRPPCCG